MDHLFSDVYSKCFLRETLPTSLGGFLHICTPLPCPVFLTMCPCPRVYTAWHDIVAVLLDPSHHPPRHTKQLNMLRMQLNATTVPLSIEDGVQQICDPDRTRYLSELINGSYVHRNHIQKLLHQAEDKLAIEQTMYMTEAILDHFPPGGLETESIQDLVTLFVHSASSTFGPDSHNSFSESGSQ
jgi:hypothetical protein